MSSVFGFFSICPCCTTGGPYDFYEKVFRDHNMPGCCFGQGQGCIPNTHLIRESLPYLSRYCSVFPGQTTESQQGPPSQFASVDHPIDWHISYTPKAILQNHEALSTGYQVANLSCLETSSEKIWNVRKVDGYYYSNSIIDDTGWSLPSKLQYTNGRLETTQPTSNEQLLMTKIISYSANKSYFFYCKIEVQEARYLFIEIDSNRTYIDLQTRKFQPENYPMDCNVHIGKSYLDYFEDNGKEYLAFMYYIEEKPSSYFGQIKIGMSSQYSGDTLTEDSGFGVKISDFKLRPYIDSDLSKNIVYDIALIDGSSKTIDYLKRLSEEEDTYVYPLSFNYTEDGIQGLEDSVDVEYKIPKSLGLGLNSNYYKSRRYCSTGPHNAKGFDPSLFVDNPINTSFSKPYMNCSIDKDNSLGYFYVVTDFDVITDDIENNFAKMDGLDLVLNFSSTAPQHLYIFEKHKTDGTLERQYGQLTNHNLFEYPFLDYGDHLVAEQFYGVDYSTLDTQIFDNKYSQYKHIPRIINSPRYDLKNVFSVAFDRYPVLHKSNYKHPETAFVLIEETNPELEIGLIETQQTFKITFGSPQILNGVVTSYKESAFQSSFLFSANVQRTFNALVGSDDVFFEETSQTFPVGYKYNSDSAQALSSQLGEYEVIFEDFYIKSFQLNNLNGNIFASGELDREPLITGKVIWSDAKPISNNESIPAAIFTLSQVDYITYDYERVNGIQFNGTWDYSRQAGNTTDPSTLNLPYKQWRDAFEVTYGGQTFNTQQNQNDFITQTTFHYKHELILKVGNTIVERIPITKPNEADYYRPEPQQNDPDPVVYEINNKFYSYSPSFNKRLTGLSAIKGSVVDFVYFKRIWGPSGGPYSGEPTSTYGNPIGWDMIALDKDGNVVWTLSDNRGLIYDNPSALEENVCGFTDSTSQNARQKHPDVFGSSDEFIYVHGFFMNDSGHRLDTNEFNVRGAECGTWRISHDGQTITPLRTINDGQHNDDCLGPWAFHDEVILGDSVYPYPHRGELTLGQNPSDCVKVTQDLTETPTKALDQSTIEPQPIPTIPASNLITIVNNVPDPITLESFISVDILYDDFTVANTVGNCLDPGEKSACTTNKPIWSGVVLDISKPYQGVIECGRWYSSTNDFQSKTLEQEADNFLEIWSPSFNQYQVQLDDAGKKFRFEVTVRNLAGSRTYYGEEIQIPEEL